MGKSDVARRQTESDEIRCLARRVAVSAWATHDILHEPVLRQNLIPPSGRRPMLSRQAKQR